MGPALRAQFIAGRRLLPEHDAPWLDSWRHQLDDALDRALEAYAASRILQQAHARLLGVTTTRA